MVGVLLMEGALVKCESGQRGHRAVGGGGCVRKWLSTWVFQSGGLVKVAWQSRMWKRQMYAAGVGGWWGRGEEEGERSVVLVLSGRDAMFVDVGGGGGGSLKSVGVVVIIVAVEDMLCRE